MIIHGDKPEAPEKPGGITGRAIAALANPSLLSSLLVILLLLFVGYGT